MAAEGVSTRSEPSSLSQCFASFLEAPSDPALRWSLILNLSPLSLTTSIATVSTLSARKVL